LKRGNVLPGNSHTLSTEHQLQCANNTAWAAMQPCCLWWQTWILFLHFELCCRWWPTWILCVHFEHNNTGCD